MAQEILKYLGSHPGQLTALVIFLVLALIGAWYVWHNHLKILFITILCAAGVASGALVLYRGVQGGMKDLVAIGIFLLIVFPLMFLQSLKLTKSVIGLIAGGAKPSPTDQGHAKRAGV